jgi:hypothetical protein
MARPLTIEGTWEEISARAEELRGRRVRLTVLDAAAPTALPFVDPQRFLRLPRAERARLLQEQSERMAQWYELNQEWRETSAGEFVEYPGEFTAR